MAGKANARRMAGRQSMMGRGWSSLVLVEEEILRGVVSQMSSMVSKKISSSSSMACRFSTTSGAAVRRAESSAPPCWRARGVLQVGG